MSGLSAKAGNVGKVFMKMPPLFHDKLYEFGIRVDPNTYGFETIDPATGCVETGDDALILISTDEKVLAAIMSLIRSNDVAIDSSEGRHRDPITDEEVPDSGTGKQLELRAIAFRSLFERFKEVNSDYPKAINDWKKGWRTFAVKLRWQSPARANWPQMKNALDPNELAQGVLANGFGRESICGIAERTLDDADFAKFFEAPNTLGKERFCEKKDGQREPDPEGM